MSPQSPTRPEQRPAIVTIIILLFVLETFLAVALASIYFAEINLFSEQVGSMVRVQMSDVPGSVLTFRAFYNGVLCLAYVIITVGLIRLQHWAWTSAMVLMGIRLAFGLGDYLFDNPAFPLLIICVLLVFLLNQRETRKAFGIIKEKRVLAEFIKRPQ